MKKTHIGSNLDDSLQEDRLLESRSSRVVRQPEDRCRSAIGRAFLRRASEVARIVRPRGRGLRLAADRDCRQSQPNRTAGERREAGRSAPGVGCRRGES